MMERLLQKIYVTMISQLGFNHDIGSQTAYSYAAIHPNNVSKLVIMDFTFPGFSPLGFHKVPDIPEMLTFGKEKEYLSSFYKAFAYSYSNK
jgi:hypothetical protein